MYFFIIPDRAEVQSFQLVATTMDSGFHWNDDFLRDHQTYNPELETRNTTRLKSRSLA